MSISLKSFDFLQFPSFDLPNGDCVVSASMATDFYLNAGTLTTSSQATVHSSGAASKQELTFWFNDNTHDYTLRDDAENVLFQLVSGSHIPAVSSVVFDNNQWSLASFKQLAIGPTRVYWVADDGIVSSPVSEWDSSSGLYSLVQPSGSNKPTTTTSYMGGRTCVLFAQSSTTYMTVHELASMFNGNDKPWTFAVHFVMTSATSFDVFFNVHSSVDDTPFNNVAMHDPLISPHLQRQSNAGSDYTSGADSEHSPLSVSTEYVLVVSFDGAQVTWYVNNDEGNTNTVNVGTITGLNQLFVGTSDRAVINPNTYANDFLNAAIRRIEFRDYAVDPVEASEIYSTWYGN